MGHLFFFGLFVIILDNYLCSKRCSVLFPFGVMALDEYRAYRYFPLLGDFENESELNRWDGDARLSWDTEVSRQGVPIDSGY